MFAHHSHGKTYTNYFQHLLEDNKYVFGILWFYYDCKSSVAVGKIWSEIMFCHFCICVLVSNFHLNIKSREHRSDQCAISVIKPFFRKVLNKYLSCSSLLIFNPSQNLSNDVTVVLQYCCNDVELCCYCCSDKVDVLQYCCNDMVVVLQYSCSDVAVVLQYCCNDVVAVL